MRLFIIAALIIVGILCLQFYQFWKTKKAIVELRNFFPNVSDRVKTIRCSFVQSDLETHKVDSFLRNLPPETHDEMNSVGEVYQTTTLLFINERTRHDHPVFASIIDQTNLYLCKNIGTAADLSILKDICQDKLNRFEENIHSTLNIPLFFGLAGTFLGIIVGLFGIDIKEILSDTGQISSIQHLIWGVVGAMTASLIGLLLTIKNTSISWISPSFKDAATVADNEQIIYFDFLRRELMPILAHSMASSLNSLRSVLGHFVDKFGDKLDDYAQTAELLNDNLDKQQQVLEGIQRLSLTKTATKTAEIFLTLKDSAESLNVFYNYQKMLNNTIANVSSAVQNIQTLLDRFRSFEEGLEVVVNGQMQAAQLQEQFRHSIVTHFPTGSDAREIWRKEFDLLVSDAQLVSKQLSSQLTESTNYIRNFTENNNQFFDTFNHLREVIAQFTSYADLQTQIYNDLKNEIFGMRADFRSSQIDASQTNKSILEAMKTLTSVLKSMK